MIFLSLLLFGLISVVDGNHFLGGTIRWEPLNASATGSPVAIVVTQTYLWTYSLMPCTSSMVASNQFVPAYPGLLTDQLNCIYNCGAGSVGYSAIDVIPRCTDFSSVVGTTVGQRSDIVYLQSGDDFAIAYQKTSWRSLATGSALTWSIGTHIKLTSRSDNGLYNNAPVATAMSPIYITFSQPTVIHIPISDADGDPMRCRWATSSNGIDECGGVCPPSSLPAGTIIYPNCTIIITGPAVANWYAVALMVEDFINSTSTTPLSSVPVQFLVYVVVPLSCSIPPSIVGIPIEDSCMLVTVNQTFVSQIIAENQCGPSITIKDIATLSFSGMIQSNLIQTNSTTYYKNLTWTPTVSQLGYQVMCAMTFDSNNAQSAQYCFKFYVSIESLCACPGEPCSTTGTSIMTTTTSSVSTTTSMGIFSTSSNTSTNNTTINFSGNASVTSLTSITSADPVSATSLNRSANIDRLNQILIGSIVGVLLLFGLILFSCVCWYYCSPCGIGRLELSDCRGPFELYYIESINQKPSRPSNPIISRSKHEKTYRVYDISSESSSSFTNQSLLSTNSDTKRNMWFSHSYTTKPSKPNWHMKNQSNYFTLQREQSM